MDTEPETGGTRPGPMNRILALQKTLAAVFLVLIVTIVATEVFLRSVFTASLGFAHDVSSYLLVAIAFFGFAIAIADDNLYRIEFVYQALPLRGRLAAQLVFDMLGLVFGSTLLVELVRFVYSTWSRGMVEISELATPLWIPQIAMPVGMLFVILALLTRIVRGVRLLARGEG